MKVLFIGGTGNISTSVSKLALSRGVELFLLNRGVRKSEISGAKNLIVDIHSPVIADVLKNHTWDVVVDWIAFTEQDVERDYQLFRGKTKQYIFISSASAYQKPVTHPVITESTPLANPFWQYSRNKIVCELKLNEYYRNEQFPITIVRPSHTYDTIIPFPIGGDYTIIDRLKRGKKIIVHGDGTSLWVVTHAEDFAKGFVGLLGNPHTIGHAFHITSDEVLTWNQIVESVADAAGCQANVVHISSETLASFDPDLRGGLIGDKACSVIFDNSKIKTFVPDFVATIPFHEGIKRTVKWFESDPQRMVVHQETSKWIDSVIEKYERGLAH